MSPSPFLTSSSGHGCLYLCSSSPAIFCNDLRRLVAICKPYSTSSYLSLPSPLTPSTTLSASQTPASRCPLDDKTRNLLDDGLTRLLLLSPTMIRLNLSSPVVRRFLRLSGTSCISSASSLPSSSCSLKVFRTTARYWRASVAPGQLPMAVRQTE